MHPLRSRFPCCSQTPYASRVVASLQARGIAVFALLLSTLAACDSGGPDDPVPFVPIAKGTVWTYSVQFRGLDAPSDTFDIAILDRVSLDDLGPRLSPDEPDSASVWAARFGEHVPSVRWLWAESPHGLHIAGGIAPADTARTWGLTYAYPAEVGTEAPVRRYAFSSEQQEFYVREDLPQTLIAVDEPFETPVGTFRTHVYLYNYRPKDDVAVTWNVYKYVAPGVGMVGQVIRSVGLVSGEERDPPYQILRLIEHTESGLLDGFEAVPTASQKTDLPLDADPFLLGLR